MDEVRYYPLKKPPERQVLVKINIKLFFNRASFYIYGIIFKDH
jgi:hypothetical protein